MNIRELERIKSYRLGLFHFDEDLNISPYGKIFFKSPEQALRWVLWLRNEVKLPLNEVVKEVELQCEWEKKQTFYVWNFEHPELYDFENKDDIKELYIKEALRSGISDIKIKCRRCGEVTNYGEACTIEQKVRTGSSSRVISTGLTGGSVVRQVTNHYAISHIKVCPKCAEKDKLRKNLLKVIKYLFWISILTAFIIVCIVF